MKTKYPCPECDEACYYHCTKNGQQEPECVTNNGWIKIESEADFVSEHDFYFLCDRINQVGIGIYCRIQKVFKTRFGNIYDDVTHYQPIQKPNPPVF